MNDWIKHAPKIDLHCHLDGSLPVSVIRTLAKNRGIALPEDLQKLREMVQAPTDCTSLKEYLEKFDLPLQCLQSGRELEYAAYELIRAAAGEGVVYLEIRFAPLLHTREELTAEMAVESVLSGLRQGTQHFGVYASAILCGMRHETADKNLELIAVAGRYLGRGVCAVDIAGNEADFPPLTQQIFLQAAEKAGIPFTVHAGECRSAANVSDAIILGAVRIGHGIAMKDDPQLLEVVKQKGVGIELCPTSNIQTKAVGSIAEYPFLWFYRAGIRLSINTDNRTVSGTTVTQELLWLLEHYPITALDIKGLTESAAAMAFTTAAVKEDLLAKIDAFYETIG